MAIEIGKECEQCGQTFWYVKIGKKPRRWCSPKCRRLHWMERNPEKDHASKKKWADEHRAQINERTLAHYHTNKDRDRDLRKDRVRQTRLKTPWVRVIMAIRARSKKKGIPFNLTYEWGAARWTGCCELTGIEFQIGVKRGTPLTFSASVDRIEPKLGYVQSNCRFILHAINAFRGEQTDQEMLSLAVKLVEAMNA